MTNLVDMYLKKVVKDTNDTDLRDGIIGMGEDDNIPSITKPRSSFKETNKRMKKIEDEQRRQKDDLG